MKRNLTFLGFCLIISLIAFLVISNKKERKSTPRTTQNLVVTQDGKVTVLMQPDRYSTGSFVVFSEQPKPNTNKTSPATNPRNK